MFLLQFLHFYQYKLLDHCFIQKAIISYKHCFFCSSYDSRFTNDAPFKQASVSFFLFSLSTFYLHAPCRVLLTCSHHYLLAQTFMSDLSFNFPMPAVEPDLSLGITPYKRHLETNIRPPSNHPYSQRVSFSTGLCQSRLFQLREAADKVLHVALQCIWSSVFPFSEGGGPKQERLCSGSNCVPSKFR